MATQDYKSKMLHYRHAIMLPKKDALLTSNLQDRLANLVKIKVPNVADRLFFPDVPDNNGNVAAHAHMVLSNSKEIHGMFLRKLSILNRVVAFLFSLLAIMLKQL